MIRSLLRPSDGDHEKSYRIIELFILITGLNICNLGSDSSWSRVADPARASQLGAGRHNQSSVLADYQYGTSSAGCDCAGAEFGKFSAEIIELTPIEIKIIAPTQSL